MGWSEMATADARSDDTRRTARRVIVLVERQNNQQEDQRKRGSGREEVETGRLKEMGPNQAVGSSQILVKPLVNLVKSASTGRQSQVRVTE